MTDLFKPENIASGVDWHVEQLRSTSFLMPMFERSAEDVFRMIAQSPPDQITENRQQAVQTAAGPFASAKLDVIRHPGRIDVLLSPADGPRASQGTRTIGNCIEVVDSFNTGIRLWLGSRAELQRLAFGAICLHEVADRKAAYSILNQLLPTVDVDIEHSTDFFYQINRPRLVTFQDSFSCKINRLSKWSAATVVLQTVMIPGAEAAVQPPAFTATLQNHCRAELDLSTDADIRQLPTHQLQEVWDKLTTFAAEILSKGDIR